MSKRVKRAKTVRRVRLLAVVIALAVLAMGAMTVLSRHVIEVSERPSSQGKSAPLTNGPSKRYATAKLAGKDIHVVREAGQIKELTPEEVAKLAAGLKNVINQSADDLEQVDEPDGSVTMDLQGRFNSVTVARENGDGTLSESCVDNAKAAGEFFDIDPNLIEKQPNTGKRGTQRPRVTPASNQKQ